MRERIRHLLAGCIAGAACLITTSAQADDVLPSVLPTGTVAAVAPQDSNVSVAKDDAAAAPAAANPGSSILADGGIMGDPCAPFCCKRRGPRVYGSGEYLMWWFQGSPEPVPLVTAVPAALIPAGPTPFRVGSLADPNASVVMGARDIDTDRRSGGRFTLGTWLGENQRIGLEGNYFFIAPTTTSQSIGANGAANSPLLSVPFFDVTGETTMGIPGQSARPIPSPPVFARDFPTAIPGETTGLFTERLTSRLQGCEANALIGLTNPANGSAFRLSALAGFRYLNLRESLSFSTAIDAGPLGFPDVVFNSFDEFTTRNNFYGGQLGVRGEYLLNRIMLQAAIKVALGDVREQVQINGLTQTNLILGPGTPILPYAGGIFAQPSNIGDHTRHVFGVLPEVDINVGYQVRDWARIFVGYNFLYLSNVVRPGNQINPSLNTTRIPFNTDPNGPNLTPAGPAQPAFSFHDSSFWAQGINFGIEFRF